jgi:hypothetical protein
VDVHTQPTDESGNLVGKVLHCGVGRVNIGVFVANCPFSRDKLMAYTGPAMSYYEMITDNFKRMTDQEWTGLVLGNTLPERPDWTNIYLAGTKGELKGKGAELPSAVYSNNTDRLASKPGILVYPNPVKDWLTVSFRLDQANSGNIALFNSTGLLVRQSTEKYFMGGDNTTQLNLNNLPEGIYLMQVVLKGREPEVVKIVKE